MSTTLGKGWQKRQFHRDWLAAEAVNLLDFFSLNTIDPAGGFYDLDREGDPIEGPKALHATTRMVHCHVAGHLLGRPGSADMIDHGMNFLKKGHRDEQFGGYMWSLEDGQPKDASKQAYGHAFVLLPASSAILWRAKSLRTSPKFSTGVSGKRQTGRCPRNTIATGRQSRIIAGRIPTCT